MSDQPITFDLDEIELALLSAAQGEEPSYHRLGYAWEALKRCGHKPRPENERAFESALAGLIT